MGCLTHQRDVRRAVNRQQRRHWRRGWRDLWACRPRNVRGAGRELVSEARAIYRWLTEPTETLS